MHDLDTVIRARLDSGLAHMTDPAPELVGEIANEWHDALLAVLDLHKPRPAGIPGKPHLADCSTCRDLGPEINSPAAYPCDEVEAIAEALGVEADGG